MYGGLPAVAASPPPTRVSSDRQPLLRELLMESPDNSLHLVDHQPQAPYEVSPGREVKTFAERAVGQFALGSTFQLMSS
jgi:hypothetical protein